MNALEIFYKDLDINGWDVNQESHINQILQNANDQLISDGLFEIQHLAEIDRQSFHFRKTPEKRLSFRAAGTQKMEDGTEIPFEWPDIREFNKNDFDYLYGRFNECKNLYAKTEYGLVLFYSKQKLDNYFVIELLSSLFELSKVYLEKARLPEDKNHYIIHSQIVIANALHIANNRKEVKEVAEIYKSIIEFTFSVHQNWEISNSKSLRTIIDFTDFAVQYFKDYINFVDLTKIITKNWEAANYLTNNYVWGAIYVTDTSIKLCKKLNISTEDWYFFKAKQYEKLSLEFMEKQNLASVSFIEKAMTIYKNLKDDENLSRLQKDYQKIRTDFKLGEIIQEVPQDETARIMELIKKEVSEKNEQDIIKTLLLTPMLAKLKEIIRINKDSQGQMMFLDILPTKIQDKFGNTVANFNSDEEQKRFSLLRTYEFHMQIATQTIIHYFIEAYKMDKISAEGILSFLKETWMGEEAIRQSNGKNINFNYIQIIESGVVSFFQELYKWKNDSDYLPNFVCATDSLVLKSEYFLREFCYFLNIPTFKSKDGNIVMERTLDDILHDDKIQKSLTEDDLFFIKFILTEKAGYNLRNRIAHGLMDNVEYGLEHPILAIIIILKLSNYQFREIQ